MEISFLLLIGCRVVPLLLSIQFKAVKAIQEQMLVFLYRTFFIELSNLSYLYIYLETNFNKKLFLFSTFLSFIVYLLLKHPIFLYSFY